MNELHGAITLARTDKRIFGSVTLVQAYPTVPALRHPLVVLSLGKCFLEIPTVASPKEY